MSEERRLPSAMAERYRRGESIASIAKDLSMDRGTVRKRLVNAGVDVPPNGKGRRRPPVAPARAARIVAMRAAGAKLREVAEAFGITPQAVAWHAKRAGVASPPLNRERNAAIRARRADGITYAQLAEEFAVSITTVHAVLNGKVKG